MLPSLPWLHKDALNLSFLFRKQIWNVFCDVMHLNNIDYISINIIDPGGEIIFFTSNPSFEYNFYCNTLCKYDKCLSPEFYKNKAFYSWEEAFDQKHASDLLLEKLEKYKFKFGCCFVRKLGDFYVIYSFASKATSNSHYEYYLKNANDMLRIGDICYQSLRSLYEKATYNKKTPAIPYFVSFSEQVTDIFEQDFGNVLFFNNPQSRNS